MTESELAGDDEGPAVVGGGPREVEAAIDHVRHAADSGAEGDESRVISNEAWQEPRVSPLEIQTHELQGLLTAVLKEHGDDVPEVKLHL